jgi:hypothetical protein
MSNESIVHLSDINNAALRVIFKDNDDYVSVNDIKQAIGYNGGGHTFLSACAMQKLQFEGKGRSSYFVKAADLPLAKAKNGAQEPFQVICDYFNPKQAVPETSMPKENVNTMPDERVHELFGDKEADPLVKDLVMVMELASEPVESITTDEQTSLIAELQAEVIRLRGEVKNQACELQRLKGFYSHTDIYGDKLEIEPVPGGGGIRFHFQGCSQVDYTNQEEIDNLVDNINSIFDMSFAR